MSLLENAGLLAPLGRYGRVLTGLMLAAAAASPCLADGERQPLGELRTTIEEFVANQTYPHPYPPRLTVGRIDPNLRLPRCHDPLEVGFVTPERRSGHVSMRVGCPSGSAWSLYVPVQIQLFADVLVAERALPRGHRLDPQALVHRKEDVSRLSAGYYSDVAELRDMELRTPVQAGRIITPTVVEARRLVNSGDKVVLIARAGGLDVRSAGQALAAGAQGERVRVRNSRSRRVVEGIVVAEGIVEIVW